MKILRRSGYKIDDHGHSSSGGRRQSVLSGALLAGAAALVLLGGCANKITKHGHLLSNADLQQVQPGMSPDQVRASLGSPATTATLGDSRAYYYVSSTMSETTFSAPKEIDRRVTAVYFSQQGTVQRVASYGLKDGKVFDFISRRTPSAASGDRGILDDLFRNIGNRSFNVGG